MCGVKMRIWPGTGVLALATALVVLPVARTNSDAAPAEKAASDKCIDLASLKSRQEKADAAIAIARKELIEKFGVERVRRQEPLGEFHSNSRAWVIIGLGHLDMIGGSFDVVVSKRTGCVVAAMIDQ
jgi:hypothetical protein